MAENQPEREMIDRKKRLQIPFLGLDFRSAPNRVLDFREVVIPFDHERAIQEGRRCIDCPDPPCVSACPLHNDIPTAMQLIANGEFISAAETFRKTNNMPEICGRVCPQEELCQGSCVLNNTGEPVLIGALEALAADIYNHEYPEEPLVREKNEHKVAVVGAGPSGLACGEQLVKKGFSVTLFESRQESGGLLMYGIPGFKMSSEVLLNKLERMKKVGVKFVHNTCIGRDKKIQDLFDEGFEAIYIGTGAGVDAPVKIPGVDLPGVYQATEFLLRANVDFKYLPEKLQSIPEVGKRVIVIGGGDTSADCVRTAKRLGADEVICAYRRTEHEMPGVQKDRKLAKEEGVSYHFLTQPVRFNQNEEGKLDTIEFIKNELGEPDHEGRRKPVPIDDSNFIIQADTAVLAIGYQPYPTLTENTPGLEVNQWGLILVEPQTGATSLTGVYAGGDAVDGPDLVVTAVAAGRKSAEAIEKFLLNK